MAAQFKITAKITTITDTSIVLTPLEPTVLKAGREIATITLATSDIDGVDQFNLNQIVDVTFQKR